MLITTLFQGGVLSFAIVARSLPPHHLILAMLVIIPLNVLVFGLDNLIYLLYFYRVQQEGLEIFLRTMLTFTGKGLLFAAGMAATWGWGLAASSLAARTSLLTGGLIDAPTLFLAGMIAGHSLLAALVLYALSRTYANRIRSKAYRVRSMWCRCDRSR